MQELIKSQREAGRVSIPSYKASEVDELRSRNELR